MALNENGTGGPRREPLIDLGMRAAFGASGVREPSSVLGPLSAASTSPSQAVAATTRYRLLGEIAHGGTGVVERCHDTDLGREVARKVLREDHIGDRDVLHRFVEEAQIGGQLEHPGIVPIYDVGLQGERPFFTMKLIRGRTLAAMLSERTDLGAERHRFLAIFLQICQTVAYAQSRGVLHRDLKPSNIMVGEFGEVQVVDWGLAKLLHEKGGKARAHGVAGTDGPVSASIRSSRPSAGSAFESETGSVMGTPAYMPPEQALGDIDALDERADVFALGAILCEILTGKPPYPGEREAALHAAAFGETGPALDRLERSGAEPELIMLARESLAIDRAARPGDAGVVAHRIESFLIQARERAHAAQLDLAEARGRATQERRARRLTVTLASVILLATIGVGGVAWAIVAARRERESRFDSQLQVATNGSLLRLGRAESSGETGDWKAVLASAEQLSALVGAEESSPSVRVDANDAANRIHEEATAALAKLERTADRHQLLTHLEQLGARDDEYSTDRDWSALDAAYAASFEDRGLDVDALGTEVVPSKAGDLELLDALRFVVDDWIRVRATIGHAEATKRLLEVANAIDPDPVRVQLRDATRRQDLNELNAMATSPDLDRLPKPTLLLLGRDLAAHSAYDAARHVMELAARLHPNDFDVLIDASDLCWRFGMPRPEEARRYLTAAIALRPESRRARHALGMVLRDQLHDLAGADDAFRDAIPFHPDDLDLQVHLAEVIAARGDVDGSKQAYERVTSAAPTDPKNLGSRIVALKALGRWDEALKTSATAAKSFPEVVRLRVEHASCLLHAGKTEEAIAEYRAALATDDRNAEAYQKLGATLCNMNRVDEAIALARTGVQKCPDAAAIHDILGYGLQLKGQHVQALERFDRAKELGPATTNVLSHRADSLAALRRVEEACTEYEAALRLDPKDIVVRVNYGNLLNDLDQPKRAIEVLDEAIRLAPNVPEARVNRGNAWMHQREYAKAEADFRDAIRLRATHATAFYGLGRSLLGQERNEDAVTAFQRAAELEPRDAEDRRMLAVALRRRGRLPEAIRRCREALELDPRHTGAAEDLAFMLCEAGAVDEAERAAAHAESVGVDPLRVKLVRALIAKDRGDGEQALVLARAVVAQAPEHATLLIDIAETLNAFGQHELAQQAEDEALRIGGKQIEVQRARLSLLRARGDYAGARATIRSLHDLGVSDADFDQPRRELALLDQAAAALTAGTTTSPSDDPASLRAFAEAASSRHVPGVATAAWTRAFKLLKAAGAAPEAGELAEAARQATTTNGDDGRIEAADWLARALELLRPVLEGDDVHARSNALQELRRWRAEPAFAPIRDSERTGLLEATEREDLEALWDHVAELTRDGARRAAGF